MEIPGVADQYKLKEGALIDFEKLLIPRFDVVCSLLFVLVIFRWRRVIFVMDGPVYHLTQGGEGGGGGVGRERREKK